MAGLAKIARQYGGTVIKDREGREIRYVPDGEGFIAICDRHRHRRRKFIKGCETCEFLQHKAAKEAAESEE